MKRWISIAIIVSSSLLCLFPSVTGVYLFDDKDFIAKNSKIEGLGSIPAYFTQSIFGQEAKGPLYRPVFMATLAIERSIFGQNPVAAHLINLVIHILCAICFYLLLDGLFKGRLSALFGGVLFAVHPIHIDALAFIVNRSDLLCLLFVLVAAILLKTCVSLKKSDDVVFRGIKWKNLCLVSLMLLFAMFSKEEAVPFVVIFPLALIIIGYVNNNKESLRSGFSLAGMLIVVTAVYLVLRYNALGAIGTDPGSTIFPKRTIGSVFPTISRVFSEYIMLLFVPYNLKVDYSNYYISTSFLDRAAIFSYLFHFCILLFAAVRIRKDVALSFLIVSFYLALLPVSHIVPFLELKALRFLYLPSIFFVGIFAMVFERLQARGVSYGKILAIMLVPVAVYGAVSVTYSTAFKDDIALWTEMVKRDPSNLKFRLNLSDAQFKMENYSGVIENLKFLIARNRDMIQAYSPLAISLYAVGDKEGAGSVFREGLRLKPDDFLLNKNFAVYSYFAGDYLTAYEHMKRALSVSPDDPEAVKMFGAIKKKYLKTVPDTGKRKR